MIPIHPDSELLELLGHVGLEGEGMLLACVNEIVDTDDVLDLFLGPDSDLIRFAVLVDPSGDVDLLLHLDLDGETVHVETGLVADVESVHPPVSQEDILDRLVECGTHVDVSRCVRRAVHEVESLSFLTEFLCLVVSICGVPVIADLLLYNRRCVVRADLFYHHESLQFSELSCPIG